MGIVIVAIITVCLSLLPFDVLVQVRTKFTNKVILN
jgi:hypothetical protein